MCTPTVELLLFVRILNLEFCDLALFSFLAIPREQKVPFLTSTLGPGDTWIQSMHVRVFEHSAFLESSVSA